MKILHCLFFLFGFSTLLEAVDNLRLSDIRSLSLGGNGVTQSLFYNPSLVALSTEKSIHLQYFNRYTLKELGTIGCAFHYPNRWLSAAVDISSFGYDDYRESCFRLSLGKQLGERWALGISLQYVLLQTSLYEVTPSRLSTDVGISWIPVDKLLMGVLIRDIPSLQLGDKSVYVEDFKGYTIQIGFQWEIINSLLIMGTLGTSRESILTADMGIEYKAFSSFWIRAGLQMAPLLPSLGVGYKWSHFTIDVTTSYHTVLGISTGIGLSFSF